MKTNIIEQIHNPKNPRYWRVASYQQTLFGNDPQLVLEIRHKLGELNEQDDWEKFPPNVESHLIGLLNTKSLKDNYTFISTDNDKILLYHKENLYLMVEVCEFHQRQTLEFYPPRINKNNLMARIN